MGLSDDIRRRAPAKSRLAAAAVVLISAGCALQPAAPAPDLPITIPVYVVRYFPVDGDRIDRTVTGDWGATLDATRTRVDSLTSVVTRALEEGTRYHGYRDPDARPSLRYEVVGDTTFLEAIPVRPRPGRLPIADYGSIVQRIDAGHLVDHRGVREIWIWGYHGGVLDLWESNMAGPHGDVSNSDRDPDDLPVFGSTYTVYHYNYQRGAAEAVENHMHQLEHVLNWFDGRDTTQARDWPDLLFWGHFVGSDSSHRLLPPIRAGWSHYPPNAERDYQWSIPDSVWTDIEDWRPDGSGARRRLGCAAWRCDHLGWFVYWMQAMPGAANGLVADGRPVRNWWTLLGDFDRAAREGWRLTADP